MPRLAQIPKRPGRPTLSDSDLMGRRDRLVWLLSVSWGDIGWELPKAKNSGELYEALAPLRGHPGMDIIAIFIRPTSASASAEEIRKLGKELGSSIDRMHEAQQEQRTCADSFREASAAIKMNHVENVDIGPELDPAQEQEYRDPMVSQFNLRKAKLQSADNAVTESCNRERNLRTELEQKEAAFAQAELLDYIAKKKYARNPLGLANAMAGLPLLAWSQSYDRSSKIYCSGWPNIWYSEFEIIQDIWKLHTSFSQPSVVQMFRREVHKLPKKTLVYYEPEKRKIWMPNHVRSRMADNFRLLRLAIEETLKTKMHPGRTPFVIMSLFEKNMDKPRAPEEALLIAHERIV